MGKTLSTCSELAFSQSPLGGLQPMYRMPVAFGPAPGPRNVPADRQRYRYVHERTQLTVDALSDPAAIAALLPPRCDLGGDPLVRVSISALKNLGWLAGRGYNIVTVQLPEIVYRGDEETIIGDFNLVLWESLCDPIITGREEIAFPKLFAEIPDHQFVGNSGAGSASWLGYRFFDISVNDLIAGDIAPTNKRPVLCHKYVPRTGDWGQADTEYMTISSPDPQQPATITRLYQTGTGKFAFNPGRWEDLPTLYVIVNTLARLPIRQFVGANLHITSQGEAESMGGGNFSGQRRVR